MEKDLVTIHGPISLKSGIIRNKIAHADYYHESDSKKLIFGNKSYEVKTVRDTFRSFYGFYCYLLLIFLEEKNLFDLLDKLKEIKMRGMGFEPTNSFEIGS